VSVFPVAHHASRHGVGEYQTHCLVALHLHAYLLVLLGPLVCLLLAIPVSWGFWGGLASGPGCLCWI
jgi:hypothetical protein